jgi:hypothetical protein
MHSLLVSIPLAIALWALMLLGVAAVVALMGRSRRTDFPSAGPAARAASAGSASAGSASAGSASAGSATAGSVIAASASAEPIPSWGAATGAAAPDPVGDDLRFAEEVAAAAEHAAATAARARAGWETAEQELDAAWAAYEQADAAARRTWAATSFPQMSRRRKLGENADRERYLHHAATVACRQRELSIAQLNDVYAHRGWNPRLHPVAQEALLRNAIRENKFAVYQKAQRRERVAWQRAEIASEALRALRAEAAAAFGRSAAEQPAVSEFWWAEPWTTSELPAVA